VIRSPARAAGLLAVLIPLGIASHTVLAGSRVAVSLAALARGASPLTVGVLMALYALLPMLSAVATGRLSDRIGVRGPLLAGAAGLAVGVSLPLLSLDLWALCASATIVGMAFMTFQIAAQRAVGEIGGPADRPRNFSLLALGYSVSGFIGPLIAGFSIDRFGHAAPFAVFAAVALLPVAVLAVDRVPLPGPHRSHAAVHHGGVLALLRLPGVREVLAINVLLSVGWDLHTIFVPIYGARIGLTASEIGMVLAAFAAATFTVRLAMPALARRMSAPGRPKRESLRSGHEGGPAVEHRILTLALFVAGAVYLLFPFARSAPTLGALSFCLGLGLGSGQPMVMSLLHVHTPAGRIGEAVGVRMSLVQTSSVAVPLLFGAVGASLGLAPVFWAVGSCLAAGGYFTRRGARR
jgi:MFS family permease